MPSTDKFSWCLKQAPRFLVETSEEEDECRAEQREGEDASQGINTGGISGAHLQEAPAAGFRSQAPRCPGTAGITFQHNLSLPMCFLPSVMRF